MSSVKVVKGKRYSEQEKGEILEFIQAHDAENGRGGKSAAAKKYGVSFLTLSAWLKAKGGSSKAGGKRLKKVPRGSKAVVEADAKGGNLKKLKELTDLAGKIDKTRAELAKLQKHFDAIKSTL